MRGAQLATMAVRTARASSSTLLLRRNMHATASSSARTASAPALGFGVSDGPVIDAESHARASAPGKSMSVREREALHSIQIMATRAPGSDAAPRIRVSKLLDSAGWFISPTKTPLIDPYIEFLSLALTRPHTIASFENDPTLDAFKAADILGACWVRANQRAQNAGLKGTGRRKDFNPDQYTSLDPAEQASRQKGNGKGKGRAVSEDDEREAGALRNMPGMTAKCYARFVTALALGPHDAARLRRLLEHIESTIAAFRDNTAVYYVPAPVMAAWTILRAEAGQTRYELGFRFLAPRRDLVLSAIKDLVGKQDTRLPEYETTLDRLMREGMGVGAAMPHTPDELDAVLGEYRVRRDTTSGLDLWERWRAEVDRQAKGKGGEDAAATVDDITSTAVRSQVVTRFIRFLSRKLKNRRPTPIERRLMDACDEAVKYFPTPLTPTIHNMLIFNRARFEDESAVTHDFPRPLHEEESIGPVYWAEDRIKDLQTAFAAAKKDGAVDVQSYMILMEGLGRLGDVEGLVRAWHELLEDAQCKRRFVQTDRNAPFPPPRALNLALGAAFLAGFDGPTRALQMFDEALQPTSPATCDLVTINTVLRHHAKKGNMQGMTSLFELADKLGFRPDVVTYTCLLQGLLRAGQMDMAKRALESMLAQGIAPNERTAGLLVADLVRDGSRAGLSAAEDIMTDMRRHKLVVDVVPWTSLIGGYYRGGWVADAQHAIKRMEASGVKLNLVGYNMLLRETGNIRSGPDEDAAGAESTQTQTQTQTQTPRMYRRSTMMSLFHEMRRRGFEPNGDTYYIMLGALLRQTRLSEAEEVVRVMHQNGYVPEKTALKATLDRYIKAKARYAPWEPRRSQVGYAMRA